MRGPGEGAGAGAGGAPAEPTSGLPGSAPGTARVVARVDVGAIERNTARLRRALARGTELCAVVKADGYGHGALPAARAALAGGASWLAVATAGEALALRAGGIADAVILVLGALTPAELDGALSARADVVAWREGFVAAVAARGGGRIHVKLDTGMGRLGTRDPAEAGRVLAAAAAAPSVQAVGAMTHFATADERGDAFFAEQLARFTAWVQEIRPAHADVVVHAANSAATLRDGASHFDMVRTGVGLYGLDPFGADPATHGLEPALTLESRVAAVKPIAPGQSAGYGRRFVARTPTHLATLPVGYGDGWRRALTNNADVLLRGMRRPLVGTVSMDNVTVDVGSPPATAVGEPAVLVGAQGDQRILAEEVARRLGTINYEVTCGLLPRIPRLHHRDGEPRG